jgi:hypothetical protein
MHTTRKSTMVVMVQRRRSLAKSGGGQCFSEEGEAATGVLLALAHRMPRRGVCMGQKLILEVSEAF